MRKGGYLDSKVENQMTGFNLNENTINFIKEIVDDISTSVGFTSSILAIITGITIIIIRNCIVNKTLPFSSKEFVLLIVLIVIYIGALIQLYRMKDVLLNRKCKKYPFRKYSYASIFDGLLCIGYIITITIILSTVNKGK